jgi:N4-gp56 family major capsid protein
VPQEIGATKNVRWMVTTNAQVWTDSGATASGTGLVTSGTQVDVYGTLILAKNAFGVVPLQKKSIQSIIKQLGSAGADDPLNQRSTVGWKTATVAKILNDDFMVRIEHGVTDL